MIANDYDGGDDATIVKITCLIGYHSNEMEIVPKKIDFLYCHII